MLDEDKSFVGSLVLDFGKWLRHVKTIYTLCIAYACPHGSDQRIKGNVSTYITAKPESLGVGLIVSMLKVISEFCIAHSYCARFLRHQRAHMSARVQNIREFLQTNLDSDINDLFLLNEHGDPHFLFYKFDENNIRNNWEKIWKKSMATFLANEINATDREVTGPIEQVQIIFPLKDKSIN